MRVLVTGAGGMVGSHMVEYLHGRGDEVIGTYYKPTVDISEISPEIPMIECDVRYGIGIGRIIWDHMPEQIYHLAAQSYPTVSWERPFETIEINVQGTVGVFEGIKSVLRYKDSSYDPVVVVACSSAEYGQTLNELEGEEICVKETAELKPLHPYGVSKVAQDLLSFQYFMNDHIRCIRARIFNSTGTRKVNDVTSDFTYRAVKAEKEKNRKIKVGNLNTRRTIMDQRDLVRALVMLAGKGQYGEVYNISSERIYQMSDILAMIEDYMDMQFEIEIDESLLRSTDERVIAGDISKLRRDTGWRQEIPMETTVQDMIEYWRSKI